MVQLYCDDSWRTKIVDMYLKNINCVCNWDLVDSSCSQILGRHIVLQCKDTLESLPAGSPVDSVVSACPSWYSDLYLSDDLWEVRISIVCLLALIKEDMLLVTATLLRGQIEKVSRPGYKLHIFGDEFNDHDLIHKAIGWLLRELGKKKPSLLRDILNKDITTIPRTTLRYAIEKFEPAERKKYLDKNKRCR
jgi:3-methyladenine DNA glycosylase AlkD